MARFGVLITTPMNDARYRILRRDKFIKTDTTAKRSKIKAFDRMALRWIGSYYTTDPSAIEKDIAAAKDVGVYEAGAIRIQTLVSDRTRDQLGWIGPRRVAPLYRLFVRRADPRGFNASIRGTTACRFPAVAAGRPTGIGRQERVSESSRNPKGEAKLKRNIHKASRFDAST